MEIICYITMLLVQSISRCAELVCQLPQTWVIVRFDDIIVPVKLGEIERLFDHLGILLETGSVLFEAAKIGFIDKLTTAFGLHVNTF